MNKFELYEKSRHTDSGITFIGENSPSNFPLHWHEHIEFHFVLNGNAKIQCGGQIIEAKKHDCLIINSNELHKSIDAEDCGCFKFKLRPSFFDNNYYIFNNLVHDDTVTSLMFNIMQMYNNTDDASLYTVKGYIFQLIGFLCRNYSVKTLPPIASQQNREKLQKMNNVAKYLQLHYATEIRAETLAEMSHYTYSYFSAAFKEVFGVSLTKYILSIRINKATTLLATTDMNITEIAISSGFSDANYFARAFKKETGYTPSQYREHVQKLK